MSARRAARRTTQSVAPGGVPTDLAAGACIEVWGDESDQSRGVFSAWRLWGNARDEWCEAHGIDRVADYARLPPALRDHAPWSFKYMQEHYPERLADKLARCGLPATWTPERRGSPK